MIEGMAAFVPVDDPTDPRLVAYTGLTDADLRRRFEEHEGVFVTEGKLAIRRLLSSPYPVRSLLVTPAVAAELDADLAGLDAVVYVAERPVMAAVAGFDVHRGALAVAGRLPLPEPARLLETAPTVVVLEGVNDHENLGAIARTARALGAEAMLLDPTCADPLYRRSVRVSMGEVLHLPFTRLAPWPDAIALLGASGHVVVALTPAGDAEPIDVLAGERHERVALLLGAEGPGLSPGALAAADRRVRIPMRAGADSLNIGHAAAIALHLVAPG